MDFFIEKSMFWPKKGGLSLQGRGPRPPGSAPGFIPFTLSDPAAANWKGWSSGLSQTSQSSGNTCIGWGLQVALLVIVAKMWNPLNISSSTVYNTYRLGINLFSTIECGYSRTSTMPHLRTLTLPRLLGPNTDLPLAMRMVITQAVVGFFRDLHINL